MKPKSVPVHGSGSGPVRGWDPAKKEEIVGKAESKGLQLGDRAGDRAPSSALGEIASFEVDRPIFSVEEANAIAEAKLAEASFLHIQAEGKCNGNADLKAGIVINVTVNEDSAQDKFNGKYFVTGASHVYKKDGYRTRFRCRRDDGAASLVRGPGSAESPRGLQSRRPIR